MSYPLVCLGQLAKFINGDRGKNYPSKDSFVDAGIPFINAGCLSDQWLLDSSKFNYISEEAYDRLSSGKIQKNDILFCLRGSVGKFAVIRDDNKGALASSLVILRVNGKVDIEYLKHYLASSLCTKELDNYQNGAAQPNLSANDFKKFLVPLPPLAEQRRIAFILDQADELRQKRQQAIEKLDQLLQATFIDMFGDPVSNPKGWDKLTIEKMLNNEKYSLKRGPFGGALKKEIFVESGYLVYEQYHALNNDFSFQRYFIDEDKYKELKAFDVKPKDIIVSCSGVNLGKLAEVPEGSPAGIINQALLKISLNQSIVLNDIFIDIFMHPSFKKAFYGDFRGAAIPNFPPMSVFKEFEFIVPPLEIQKKYQSVKSQVKALQKNHQLADEMNLFSSLQNQAFNGTL